jgi:fatty acid desaturase
MGQGHLARQDKGGTEWPTIALIVLCYGIWFIALWWLPLALGIFAAGLVTALHASLQHEVIHGHPFRSQWLNDALIWPPLLLTVPYARFKATHLAHHHDEVITDPYDDPESNFLDGGTWERLSRPTQMLLAFNNTVLGRVTIGPLIGTVAFMLSDWRTRDSAVIRGWLWHVPAVAAVLAVVMASPMPVWAYLISAYIGMAILKVRTYLEHQANERASGRSVIVEKGGIFGFLFLNNNLHVVHHMHPCVPWFALPALYAKRKDHYLRRNGGYFYASYGEVFRRYFLRAKDPVAHPLWRR